MIEDFYNLENWGFVKDCATLKIEYKDDQTSINLECSEGD